MKPGDITRWSSRKPCTALDVVEHKSLLPRPRPSTSAESEPTAVPRTAMQQRKERQLRCNCLWLLPERHKQSMRFFSLPGTNLPKNEVVWSLYHVFITTWILPCWFDTCYLLKKNPSVWLLRQLWHNGLFLAQLQHEPLFLAEKNTCFPKTVHPPIFVAHFLPKFQNVGTAPQHSEEI